MPCAAALLDAQRSACVGLVPCAQGGTTIDEWAPGTPLFERMVSRAAAAMASAPEQPAALRAVLWYQGESDAESATLAAEYERKMVALVAAMRERLHAPRLPLVQVLITTANAAKLPHTAVVRRAQRGAQAVCNSVVPVDAQGLPLSQEDGIHLTTEAQLQLGRMLADACGVLGAE